MKLVTLRTFAALAFVFVTFGAAQTAHAQSSIWLVPTTDAAPADSKYVEGGVVYNPRSYENGGYAVGVGRSIFGLGHGIEVGGNIVGTKTNQPNPVEFQPNIKLRWFADDEKGLAIASGVMTYVPVANASYGGDTFGMVYTVASKKFGDSGPRVTAGAYGLVGRDSGTGSRAGALFGIEQPLTKNVTLMVDHYTGNQVHGGFGSTTAGLLTTINKNVVVGTAWTFANTDMKGSNGFLGFVGFTF